MKNILPLLLLSLVVVTGCSRRYIVTMQNGNQISAHGKPKLKDGVYYFKDSQGEPRAIPSMRVREVAPASMASPPERSGY